MNIVCTGGRDYNDFAMVSDLLERLQPQLVFVGDASGADQMVIDWCNDNNTSYRLYKADWDKHGLAAGPIRNKEMLKDAGSTATVIAFPGGKGTENCIKTAIGFNMIVLRVER